MKDKVKAWKEVVVIPTYEVGKPEKYPFFLEKRVYQGSSGVVYPNPVIEHISDEPIEKEWQAIFIENKYLKIMVLPELGGRIQMAYDKMKQRHFVYYNHVIKPALVGLTGPWISGGIEFNWPQHHRPSTYEPVDSCIELNKDGSATVWVSEIERMFRTKGMAGFTLYPAKAYLEIHGQLYNRTPHPQTFLWWANPAVAVNDHYQSVFPPDVHAVFDHGKRDVSEFPIAKGEYYKVNYAPGTDISRYKNIPVPTSYMAITSKYDFVGGYENDTKAGLLHIADHNISPGKKQWTWGNGDFGQAWDRNLTDSDGPYIELMCGVYTDNQPDFSWMHPYEEKNFKQYFMPYQNVGVVKNATKEALLNLEIEKDKIRIKLYVTADYVASQIKILHKGNVIFEETVNLAPEKKYELEFVAGEINYSDLHFLLLNKDKQELLTWIPEPESKSQIPEPAKPAKEPEDIENTEKLFLRGLHLEQYRHATFKPTDYYLEALRREPEDIRNNNAMGLWYLKRGQFEKATNYFEKAVETLTKHNPNPYDGEPYFNLGLALKFQGKLNEAYQAFFKSCWNAAWQDAGYFNLSQIACSRNEKQKALEFIDQALVKNGHNHKARHLKATLLRKSGALEETKTLIQDSLKIDKFNFGILFEKYLITGTSEDLENFKVSIRDFVHNYIELAIDYAQAGEFDSAIKVLEIYTADKNKYYPMAAYFLADFHQKIGDKQSSANYYQKAQSLPMDYCFPNRLEETVVLKNAIKSNSTDDKAYYYLGNFWYAYRQYKDARTCWENSLDLNPNNPICNRNLALLYFNKLGKKEAAKAYLEKAFEIDNTNPRVLMELDQLHKKINISPESRLKNLEKHQKISDLRDDLYLEKIALYNFLGENQKALTLLQKRSFHPWEGGEGKVPFQYVTANLEIAKKLIFEKEFSKALGYLENTKTYPHNLGEGKLFGTQENDVDFWLGYSYGLIGETSKSQEYYSKASEGLSEPNPAMFYNDQQPDKIFYKGLALKNLSRMEEAQKCFNKLIKYGQDHKDDDIKIDYFAISLPDLLIFEEDLNVKNNLDCHYLIGLGLLGLGQFENAEKEFRTVLKYDNSNIGAKIHLDLSQNEFFKIL